MTSACPRHPLAAHRLGRLAICMTVACGGPPRDTPRPSRPPAAPTETAPPHPVYQPPADDVPGNLVVPVPADRPQAGVGGTLRLALPSSLLPGLFPYVHRGGAVTELSLYINDVLARPDPADPTRLLGHLAAAITTPDEGRSYRVRLREGLHWHRPTVDWASGRYGWLEGDGPDGRHPLRADDYAFAFEVLQNPQVQGRANDLRAVIPAETRLTVIDPTTFEVDFGERLATNLSILTALWPSPRWLYRHDESGIAFPEETWGLALADHWYGQRGIGVGPYRFVRWEPGVALELEADALHWEGPPAFDQVVFKVVADQEARRRLLQAGDLDLVALRAEQYAQLFPDGPAAAHPDNPHIRARIVDTNDFVYLGWNLTRPPLSDRRVRTALGMALNRPDIIDHLYHGLGRPTSGPFGTRTDCTDPDIAPLPFDLAAAAQLLTEAGWVDSDQDGIRDQLVEGRRTDLRIELLLPIGSSEWTSIASVYREDLLSIGVAMVPLPVSNGDRRERLQRRDYDAFVGVWLFSSRTDLMQLWHSSGAEDPDSSNFIGLQNREVDALAEALRVAFDPAERQRICHAFHAIYHREQPTTPVMERRIPILYWDHLRVPGPDAERPTTNLRALSARSAPAPR